MAGLAASEPVITSMADFALLSRLHLPGGHISSPAPRRQALMVSRRTRVASWIFRRDHPSRPKAMICCYFSSFKTFATLREATYPHAAVNVLYVSSESMAAFGCLLRRQKAFLSRADCRSSVFDTVDTSTLKSQHPVSSITYLHFL